MRSKYNLEIGGKIFEIEINKLAEQANGSVFVKLGDTLVLATVTMGEELENIDFFPLTVEFEEKYYAAGKILGSRFFRREGRPSDEAILTARLIDRAIRPLFPKNFRREIQVIVSCYSFDEENDPDIPGLLAASLSLLISDIPFLGPVAPIRITKNKGGFVLNSSYQEREKTDFDLVLSGVKRGKEFLINMIEAQAREAKEKEILEAIEYVKKDLEKIINFQLEIAKSHQREKVKTEKQRNDKIEEEIKRNFEKELEKVLMQKPSRENKGEMRKLKERILKKTKEEFGEEKVAFAQMLIEELLKEILHRNILKNQKRPDGRKFDEIRPIYMEIGILPRTHGSALFVRGKTKSLSSVTLGSPGDQRLIEGMEIRGKKRFMHHYNFPPFCSGEIKPIRGPSRREIGHGMLVEKALLPLIPDFEDFPYTVRVVTEILSSNGSTSMASISSSSLALMDAGVPIKKHAAGIAIGLVSDENEYRLLCDIQGPEDHYGDMDFKVAGTEDGICAIQLDVKIEGLTLKMIEETLNLAKRAREEIIEKMKKVIQKPRSTLSPFAPKILRVKVNPEKVGEVIGPGGRVINEIIEKCEVSIDIEEGGNIYISSQSEEAVKKAAKWIENITREIKVGETFQGKVKRILDFGAVIEVMPEREGLLHISQIAPFKIRKVSDVIKVGEIIPVKVIDVDELGRPKLKLLKRINPKKIRSEFR